MTALRGVPCLSARWDGSGLIGRCETTGRKIRLLRRELGDPRHSASGNRESPLVWEVASPLFGLLPLAASIVVLLQHVVARVHPVGDHLAVGLLQPVAGEPGRTEAVRRPPSTAG